MITKKAAGVVAVRQTSGGALVLVLRAYRNWDFPKGLLEPGESPRVAALRELAEETGLRGARLAWGEDSIETEPYAGGKTARFFVVAIEGNGEVSLSREHHEYRWLTFAEARKLLVPRLQRVLDWAENTVTKKP